MVRSPLLFSECITGDSSPGGANEALYYQIKLRLKGVEGHLPSIPAREKEKKRVKRKRVRSFGKTKNDHEEVLVELGYFAAGTIVVLYLPLAGTGVQVDSVVFLPCET